MTRRLLALSGCVVLVVAGGAAAAAAARGGHAWLATRAVLANHLDGSDRARSAFDVRITRAAEVTASNLSVAQNRCDDCRSVAVSFQVLVAGQGPTDVTVTNDSAAVNLGCARCDSLSLAYQFVVVSDDDLGFSAAGQRELARAQADLRGLLEVGPADAVIEAEVAAIATRVQRLLTDDLHTRPVLRVRVDHPAPPPRPTDDDTAEPAQPTADAAGPPPAQRPADAARALEPQRPAAADRPQPPPRDDVIPYRSTPVSTRTRS
jgi:hypothetical protein